MSKLLSNWLENLPKAEGYQKKIRNSGYNYLKTIGLPNKSSEDWQSTDIRKLEEILSLPLNLSFESTRSFKMPSISKGSYRVILDSNIDKIHSDDLPEGISLLTQDEIINFLNSDISNQTRNNITSAINEASTNKIFALKISESNSTPIEIIIKDSIEELTTTRLLFIIENNAKLDLLEIIKSSSKSANSHLSEIYLSSHSSVNHGIIAVGSEEGSLFSRQSILQEPESSYSLSYLQEGWGISRIEPYIVQLKGHASTNLKGLQVANNEAKLSTYTFVRFNGPGGNLEQLNKAIAFDSSTSIFNGIIEVPQIAQQTKASQLSKNLLISEKAEIYTKPELRIIADDVKCTHGATVSQLEESELFYLQSRGLSLNEASSLIMKGYTKEIIDFLPVNANRWESISKYLKK